MLGNIAHYKVLEELGGGGMGVVYKAEDTKLGRIVALKVLPPEQCATENDKARLMREARSAAALRHPNICTVYEIGEDDCFSYISMAYIPGKSVKEVIAGGPLEIDQALDIAVQVAQGLQAAHGKDIVHRDIKSANINIDNDGHVTILDFGLAKPLGQPEVEEQGGTVAYMSPEQAQDTPVDHRTDIWSLGVCLYEMMTGRMPFEGYHNPAVIYQIVNQKAESPSSLRSDVPEAVTKIIEKAMAKDRADRYQSVDIMLADLKLVQEEKSNGKTPEPDTEPSIAVLPFTNMSADKNQDYFCDGIAEDIINSLAHIEGLRVAARTSSFAFRNTSMDIREIGGKLGVDKILEGSVQKAGDRLRIIAQLVNVADGYHLWSERYDRELRDVFAIQDEIGQHIVDALKITLTEKEKRALEKVPTTDLDAYDFYIRGRQYFHGVGVKGLEYARNMFTSAIIRDPQYALAYCGLADSYSMIYTYHDSDKTNIENAITASQRALELDGDLAEAHASHGLAFSLDGCHDEAEEEFERAIDMSPKLFEAYYYFARMRRVQGRPEEAVELFAKASAVRPEDYQAPILWADTCRGMDRPEEMREAFWRGLAAAEKHLEFHADDARAWYLGAHAQFELGERDKAIEWNERAKKLGPNDPATLYNAACLFCVMGEYDKSFDCFEKAIDNGFDRREWIEKDPDMDPIRGDPRFKALLERLT